MFVSVAVFVSSNTCLGWHEVCCRSACISPLMINRVSISVCDKNDIWHAGHRGGSLLHFPFQTMSIILLKSWHCRLVAGIACFGCCRSLCWCGIFREPVVESWLCSTKYKTLWDSEVNTSDGGFAFSPAWSKKCCVTCGRGNSVTPSAGSRFCAACCGGTGSGPSLTLSPWIRQGCHSWLCTGTGSWNTSFTEFLRCLLGQTRTSEWLCLVAFDLFLLNSCINYSFL